MNLKIDNPILSLCMIVRNEEKNLSSCLESVKDIVETLKDEKGISKQTIYKKHKRLRDLFIIKVERPPFVK